MIEFHFEFLLYRILFVKIVKAMGLIELIRLIKFTSFVDFFLSTSQPFNPYFCPMLSAFILTLET